MAVVKNLMVRAGADFSGMKREMEKASKNLSDFKNSMNSTLKGIGAAIAAIGIGSVVKDAVKSAMDVEASMGMINRTMGTSAAAFQDWANKSAIAFNMGKSDALKYGAVYSNLISGFAKDTATTTKYTEDLLKASAVVAAGTGRTMDDVMERIRSGMLGNTESIEDLGINVNVAMIESTKAFQQFANGKSWNQLNFQTQQQIRLFAILEQSTQKYGDAVANNTNSKQQQFVAQLKNIQLSLGQAFLPIYNAVLPALTSMASALSSVMSVVAQFSQALFGTANAQAQTKATVAQANAVNSLGNAYTAAGQAAQGSVAGFDEVNTLTSGAGGAAGAGGNGAASPAVAMDAPATGGAAAEISKKVQEMADKVKAAFVGMKNAIVDNKDLIIAALAGIASGFATYLIATNWAAIIGGIRTAFISLGLSIEGAWAALTGPIGLIALGIAALVAAFVYFYRTNESFRGVVDGILKAIGDTAVWLWNSVLVPFGAWIGTVFVAAWEGLSVAVGWLWKNILVPLGDFMLWFWKNVVSPLGAVLSDVLGVAFKTVADIAKAFWIDVLIPLGTAMKESVQPAVEALSAVFTFLWNDVLKPFGTWLGDVLKPYFTAIVTVIEYLWKEVLKPLAEYVGAGFVSTFTTVFTNIGTLIGSAKDIFVGLMTFIKGTFKGDWETAWNGMKEVFSGVFGGLYAIVKTPLDLIINAINAVIAGLNSIKIDLPDWIPGLGGKSFGINIPSIPHLPALANGGITNGPMAAWIGDNPGGQEVVSPLSDMMDMIQSAVGTAVMAASQMNGSKQGDIVLQVDGTAFARVLNPFTAKESSRIGGPMITT